MCCGSVHFGLLSYNVKTKALQGSSADGGPVKSLLSGKERTW